MTASEKVRWLQSLPGETISPKELAAVAGGTPYSYNMAAKNGNLDLPHLWRGRNLRIWKGPVIRLIGGENVQEIQDSGRKTDEGQNDERRSAWNDLVSVLPSMRGFLSLDSTVGSNLKGAEHDGHS